MREDKSVTSLKIFAKLVNKNAIKHQKGVPSQKIFTAPIYPPSQNLAKTSWTLPQDFQTVCIYEKDRHCQESYLVKDFRCTRLKIQEVRSSKFCQNLWGVILFGQNLKWGSLFCVLLLHFFTRFFLFACGSYVIPPYSLTTPMCLYVKERIKIFLSLKFFNALCDILQSLMSMT